MFCSPEVVEVVEVPELFEAVGLDWLVPGMMNERRLLLKVSTFPEEAKCYPHLDGIYCGA